MGLGKSLKKLAGSGLSPVGSLMYKKDGSTREGFKSAAKVLSPAYALMGKSSGGAKSGSAEPQEGAPEAGRPRSRGMMRIPEMAGRVFSQGKAMRGASTQGMKKGGSVSARADGIAKKGKTKGRMV